MWVGVFFFVESLTALVYDSTGSNTDGYSLSSLSLFFILKGHVYAYAMWWCLGR